MFFNWLRNHVRNACAAGVEDFVKEFEEGGGDAQLAAEAWRRRLAPAPVPALPAGGGDDAEESAGPAKAKRGR